MSTNDSNTNDSSKSEYLGRLVEERQRLGLSVAQFACLVGVSKTDQDEIEAGKRPANIDYMQAVRKIGGDPMYIQFGEAHRQANTHPYTFPLSIFGDDAFFDAVSLFRKSMEAVDAFLGEDTAKQHPELVAALMHATVTSEASRMEPGPGGIEDHANTIAGAIESASEAVAEAIASTKEDTNSR